MAAFARARELASREKDASERFSAYYGLWLGHFTRGEPAPMREVAELFLREAAARPDCSEALVAHRISGGTCLYLGDYAAAHNHFRKTVELYDPARHGDFAVTAGSPHNSIARGRSSICHNRATSRPVLNFSVSARREYPISRLRLGFV